MENYNIEPYENKNAQRRFDREEAYLRAKKKVDKIVGFYWHLAVYIVVNIFLIILIATNTEEGLFGFGPYATACFWGIGLVFHFLGVFGPNFMFGKDWEARKIKEYMDKDNEDFKQFE